MPTRPALATFAAVLALGLSACGGSSNSSSSSATSSSPAPAASSASSSVSLAADPGGALKFDKSSLSAKAGKVTIDFTNSSQLPHNVTIAGSDGSVVGATPTFAGGSKSLSVTLKPGTYTFFCSVPGHREAGMQGTLTVS